MAAGPAGEPPKAWLAQTARNAAMDVFRRGQTRARHEETLRSLESSRGEPEEPLETPEALRDELLRLIFTCCHPALAVEARIALCLRIVCGLETNEVARALLVTDSTMAQRLVRAKRKISEAGIAYRMPDADDVEERLASVHRVLYLIFNEGYLATATDAPMRVELATEAIRLARLLSAALPDDSETRALLALFLLQHSRRDARFDAAGEMVLLADQDRSRWRRDEIAEGLSLARSVFEAGRGRRAYALQAAISAVHAAAPHAGATDWEEICLLYEALGEVDPSPVVALNHAVAIAHARGPEAGLARVEALAESKRLASYTLYHATRAELLRRCGRNDEAREADERALAQTRNPAERALLRARIEASRR